MSRTTPIVGRVSAELSRRTPVPVRRAARGGLVRVRHVGLGADDVVFASFPKSGNTWFRFVLAQALSGEPMDFDRVRTASPNIGEHRRVEGVLPRGGRLVKSHELPRFVGRTRPRALYLVRDGRDVAISYRTHLERRGFAVPALPEFVRGFARGEYGGYGSWQDHVTEWTTTISRGDVRGAVVRYEDVLASPVPSLRAALETLGLPVTDEALAAAFADNTPEAMRAKEEGSRFLSTAKVERSSFVGSARSGGWRERLDADVVADFDAHAGRVLTSLGYELAAPGR